MRLAIKRLALIALVASIQSHAGLAHAEEASDLKSVFVEVQGDGTSCIVRAIKVPCQDVLIHLRSNLKLPAGTWVRFKADRLAPYQSVKAVIDAVQKSEYTTSAAYAPPPKSDQPK